MNGKTLLFGRAFGLMALRFYATLDGASPGGMLIKPLFVHPQSQTQTPTRLTRP
jgi:hypothetical protein